MCHFCGFFLNKKKIRQKNVIHRLLLLVSAFEAGRFIVVEINAIYGLSGLNKREKNYYNEYCQTLTAIKTISLNNSVSLLPFEIRYSPFHFQIEFHL